MGTTLRRYPTSKGKGKAPARWQEGQDQVQNQTLPEMLRRLKQTFCAPGPKHPTETETELCPNVSCGVRVSSGLLQGRGSGGSRPGYGISPLGGGRHEPHHRAARTYTGLENRHLEGTNRTLCAPGTKRKEQSSHKRVTQTCLGVSRSLQWRCVLVVACCRAGGTECSSTCMGSFEGGHHYLHYLHHSLAPGK